MAIEFPCWNCGKSLKASPSNAGKKCKCSGCEEINTIPETIRPSNSDQEELQPEIDEADEGNGIPSPPSKTQPRLNDHGKVYCYKCGTLIFEEAEICPHCGVRQKRAMSGVSGGSGGITSRVTAFLFAFFLGLFGAHRFYLGQTGMGVVYLLIGLFGWVVVFGVVFISGWGVFVLLGGLPQFILAVVCLIEAITYLSMSDEQFTAKYGR